MRAMLAAEGATIFGYCERGANSAFWAEPMNALTNAGFLVAAFAGLALLARTPGTQRSLWHYFFIVNFMAIGVGSFAFHTVPNALTVKADTGPIGVFMIAYLAFAMRRLLGLSWYLTAAAIAAFMGVMIAALNVQCWDGRFGFLNDVPHGARAKCLNGSLGYVPALCAMWLTGVALFLRRHPASSLILAAGSVFVFSLVFRSLDFALCNHLIIAGHKTGTHFVWHILNSLTLFLLLKAAIRHGNVSVEVIPPRPEPRPASFAMR
jgi:hypothetical protein